MTRKAKPHAEQPLGPTPERAAKADMLDAELPDTAQRGARAHVRVNPYPWSRGLKGVTQEMRDAADWWESRVLILSGGSPTASYAKERIQGGGGEGQAERINRARREMQAAERELGIILANCLDWFIIDGQTAHLYGARHSHHRGKDAATAFATSRLTLALDTLTQHLGWVPKPGRRYRA